MEDYLLLKDTCINISVYRIHYEFDVWPNPEKFTPEWYYLKLLYRIVPEVSIFLIS